MSFLTFANKLYEKIKPSNPTIQEISPRSKTDFWQYFIGMIISNPDYVLAVDKNTKGLAIFREMTAKDPHLKSIMDTRKRAVVGLDWEVIPYSKKNRDVKIAEDIGAKIVKTNYRKNWFAMLSALDYGYSVLEILYQVESDGSIGFSAIKSRDPQYFGFDIDGNLRMRTMANLLQGDPMPKENFIIINHDDQFENYYGQSILSSCFWYWFFKKNCLKFWMVLLERFGSPHVMVKHPKVIGDLKTSIEDFINDFQNRTGWYYPEGVEVSFLEASRTGDAGYQKFIDVMNAEMSKAILGQTATTEGTPGKLGNEKERGAVRQDILESDAKNLEEILNGQLIKYLCDYNYTNLDGYPIIKLHCEPPEDLNLLSQVHLRIFGSTPTGLGVPVAKNYFYETYGVPAPSETDELLNQSTGDQLLEAPVFADYLKFASVQSLTKQCQIALLKNYKDFKEKVKKLEKEGNFSEIGKLKDKFEKEHKAIVLEFRNKGMMQGFKNAG